MSVLSRLLPFAALVVSRSPLVAADAGAPAPGAPAVAAGYHLKAKSIFTFSETARPPFWPIGYTHQNRTEVKAAAPVLDFKLDGDQYALTSILMGSPSLAVINGRPYAEGEFLRLPRNRQVQVKTAETADPSAPPDAKAAPPPAAVKIRVAKILDGAAVLEAAGQRVTIPMRRPVLQLHKPDDGADLLNQ